MSGTSIDGIDAALVDFADHEIKLVAFYYQAFPAALKQNIQRISQPDQPILLTELGTLDVKLGQLFAETALALLKQAQLPADKIQAIGSHGQTIYHAPESQTGFSMQIGDPNRIAQMTGITTVCDFRRRDIAVGGQGAPLVPAFHHAAFADTEKTVSVINIGGIANISKLAADSVTGFDTGPGNTLMDYWCLLNTQQSYDANGSWARTGKVIPDLLQYLLDDPYFRLVPPKSTGKEYFSPAWLTQKLAPYQTHTAEDIQATLCQLSATSIALAISAHAADSEQILLCGGGVHNSLLIEMLQAQTHIPLTSTAAFGIDPDHVEAIAFAWLARQTLNGMAGNLTSVTGAKAPVILGGIYPGQTPA